MSGHFAGRRVVVTRALDFMGPALVETFRGTEQRLSPTPVTSDQSTLQRG